MVAWIGANLTTGSAPTLPSKIHLFTLALISCSPFALLKSPRMPAPRLIPARRLGFPAEGGRRVHDLVFDALVAVHGRHPALAFVAGDRLHGRVSPNLLPLRASQPAHLNS